MDGQRRRDVAIAILAAVAITLAAVAAAPLFGQGPTQGPGDAPDQPGEPSPEGDSEDLTPVWQLWILVLGAVFAVWRFVVYAIERVLSFIGVPEIDISTNESTGGGLPAGNRSEDLRATATPNGSGLGEGAGTPFGPHIDGTVAVVLLATILLLVAYLAVRYDVVDAVVRQVAGDGRSEPRADLDELGRVAGTAAERVEAAESPEAAENAVYSAWTEMVSLLGAADPQSETPRQFADAAVEAGMDADDVAALTGTFEEVRYGGASPSADRRRRASDAFRRIEAAYGDGGTDQTTDRAGRSEVDG